MRKDPLPSFCTVLELKDRTVAFLDSVDFPTETLMTLEFGIGVDYLLFRWISQTLQGRRSAIPGSLVVLDTSLQEALRDAWDWGTIQQIVFPGVDNNSSTVPRFRMALQIANLREVEKKPLAGVGAGHKTGNLNCFCCKMDVGGVFTTFVGKMSGVTVNLGNVAGLRQATGPGVSNLVMTLAENMAGDFRSWKQSGGKRDITIQYLSTSLTTIYTMTCKGATVDHIHPAAPTTVNGDTQVTLKIGSVLFSL